MLGGAREKAMKTMVEKMIDGETGDIFCGLVAGKEIDLLRRIDRLHDALGINEIEQVPSKEDRKEQLKGLVKALLSNEIPAFWFDQVAVDHLENPDDAREYLDLEGDEWRSKIDTIVRSYRKQGDERPRSEIVADYVNRKFDVDVGWFVAHVVNWTPIQHREVRRRFLLGNFDAVGRGIDQATEAIENAEVNDATDD